MRTQAQQTGVPRSGWLLSLVIAICAAGAGITGTLLWVQNHAPAPTGAAQPPMVPVTPVPDAPASAMHEPPATLTVGMTPAQAALTLGNWYYDHERWPVAIACYQKAVAGGLDNPNIRTDWGNCYRFAQQPQKALAQYRVAQKQNPQHEQSLFNQGGLYAFSLKQPDKAIAVWRRYLQVFPNSQSANEARQLIARVQSQQSLKRKSQR